MTTATITRVDYAALDGVLLLSARCDGCGATVHHGGGYQIDRAALGDRVAHCSCDGYDLIDPDAVIAEAMPRLRVAFEIHQRQAARRATMAALTEAPDAATASATA